MILNFGHITLELTVRDINFIVKSINWTLINESTLESINDSFFYDRESSYYLQNEIAEFIRQGIEEQHFSLESNGPFNNVMPNEINPGEVLSREALESVIRSLEQNATRI
jgi:hypothetical protein